VEDSPARRILHRIPASTETFGECNQPLRWLVSNRRGH
jgi:hypothetical protein